MDKELREILKVLRNDSVSYGWQKQHAPDSLLDTAHSAITKLFKERMLELIGSDLESGLSGIEYCRGYNQAKAELRKKVEGENG
jgi:hypothetical protein